MSVLIWIQDSWTLMVFLKEYFGEKKIVEWYQTTTNALKLPSMHRDQS